MPKLRDAHDMTICPSGLLRWRIPVFQSMILKLIKVLLLSEVSMDSPSQSLGKLAATAPSLMLTLVQLISARDGTST